MDPGPEKQASAIGGGIVSWKVIAASGERFTGFAPYVASVNEAGAVAFQASLPDGGTHVFSGRGGEVTAAPAKVAAVTSHPDLNDAADMSFYGELAGGGQGVFLVRDGRLETIADARGGFASIGPAGPTMNESGGVAFRAHQSSEVPGIFVWDGAAVSTIAISGGTWSEFHGLPVIENDGTVVFRADRDDGVQGIYAAHAGSVRTIVDTGEDFETLGLFPSVQRGVVAFAATLRDGGGGIFTADDGQIAQVERDGAFESFRGALIGGAGVVLIATPRGGSLGLFTGPDPVVDRILAVGDALFDSTVADFAANPVSINAVGQVAVRVTLTDGRELILRADPPGR